MIHHANTASPKTVAPKPLGKGLVVIEVSQGTYEELIKRKSPGESWTKCIRRLLWMKAQESTSHFRPPIKTESSWMEGNNTVIPEALKDYGFTNPEKKCKRFTTCGKHNPVKEQEGDS